MGVVVKTVSKTAESGVQKSIEGETFRVEEVEPEQVADKMGGFEKQRGLERTTGGWRGSGSSETVGVKSSEDDKETLKEVWLVPETQSLELQTGRGEVQSGLDERVGQGYR